MVRAFGLLLLLACGDDSSSSCERDSDCPAFHRCLASSCRPLTPEDAGSRDAGLPRDGGSGSDAGDPGPRDAGSGTDARVPRACDNAMDGMAFARQYGAMMNQSLGDALEDCITSCFAGERVPCFDACAMKRAEDALSPPCRLCIAEFMSCGVEYCATECFPTMGAMCGSCLCDGDATMPDASCEQVFRACAGVRSPFEYGEVGFMCP